jgi:hypothetical protein
MDVLQILNKINDRLPATRGDLTRVKALVIEVDSKTLSKADIRSRTRKLVAAYRELPYETHFVSIHNFHDINLLV